MYMGFLFPMCLLLVILQQSGREKKEKKARMSRKIFRYRLQIELTQMNTCQVGLHWINLIE